MNDLLRGLVEAIRLMAAGDAELGEIQKLFVGLDREKDRDKMRDLYNEFQQGPLWASWREETVREIRALLEAKCG